MSTNYKIQMHHYNGTDYDNLFPISTSVTSVFAGVTTPEEHGASNDGSADATNGIQDALNSGKIVIFDGIYRVDNTITLPSNAYLIGQNCKLIPAYDSNGIVKTMFSGTSIKNVVFENMNFEGTYTASTPTIDDNIFSHSLIKISDGDSVIFENCAFKNITGVICSPYDDLTSAQSFWKQNGDIITLRGITNSLIHNCTLNHACANSAICILPALSSSDLNGFNTTIDGLNVLGVNDANPPLTVLCESATIKNVYYDENCSGITGESAMCLFALNLNVDNINCFGTYATVISCDGYSDGASRFQNDNVNISNVNVVCQSAIAITCVAKSCNINNLTGSMNSAVAVYNVVDTDLNITFFPWKYATLGEPSVNVTNANIRTYDGDNAVFIIAGSPARKNGNFNISNSKIDIQTANTKYQPFTLFGGSLVMSGVNINGDCNRTVTNDFNNFDYGYNASSVYGSYVVYYGGILTSSTEQVKITSILSNTIDITNCVVRRVATTSHPLYLCVVHGCLRSVCVVNNDLMGLISSYGSDTSVVIGNYADKIIVKNNLQNNYKPSFIIGYRKCEADYPVCLGRKSRGDLSIVSNNLSYNDYAAYDYGGSVGDRYGTLYYKSTSNASHIGDLIGATYDTDVVDGRLQSAYTAWMVIYCSGSISLTTSSDARISDGTFQRKDSGNNHCVAISVANEWGNGIQRSVNPTIFNQTYMGYTS